MGKLPTDLSGRQVRMALEGSRFVFRRLRGRHMILRREQPYARLVVHDHKRVRAGTLRGILHQADLTIEDSVTLLRPLDAVIVPRTKTSRAV